ncbi:hypothetical protein O3597_04585 [Verrucosispora sp. WMMA2044]|uniref:Uncharacterized protein n=1 Tax=Verrucosispora sioxanthis TaxID=2499994 RepID=A0A6M1LAZ0_9ACTN|nr:MULTISPECIES: hypothetical protein [Micromonospora]NEE66358.1 hypothetical protein [Verrucosispora sioxanthis]NGM15468.1 hypothetical protein [Verrucosispora sioxanthis]WBB49765.1 hypothetical protein O3597_04585 [Verrucosispora sp. WMMA2044]
MSSGSTLPRTGFDVVTIGGTAGVGVVQLSLPLVIAAVGVLMVVAGACMIRMTFRRGRPIDG